MSKNGQARVLDDTQFTTLLNKIKEHRYPEKNTLIMMISFKLGLRVQEISLLRIREVAELGPQHALGFKLKDILVLPKRYTKGARASRQNNNRTPIRHTLRFTLNEFDRIVNQIEKMAKAGVNINPKEFYPDIQKHGGKTRELPLVDKSLLNALKAYLLLRITQNPKLKPEAPLILNQKGNAYSPNTLQDHMSMMLKKWGELERASSHSGRRTLATTLLHKQGEHLKTVQQILGHANAATTTIYQELPESEIRNVLKKADHL